MRQKTQKFNPVSAVVLLVFVLLAFLAGQRYEQGSLWQRNPRGNNGNTQLPEDLNYESVEKVYDTLRANFDGELSEQDLLDGLKAGLARASGDPYTVYLNQEEAKQFADDLNGNFVGIGAELGQENESLIVVAPLKGYPAARAGLRARDAIVKIDDTDTYGMSVEEAVLKIRGEKGTKVTLTIIRDGKQLEFTLTREEIHIPSVKAEMLNGKIGYIEVNRFSEDTAKLVSDAAQSFKRDSAKGVILDLRNNGGGYLTAAVDVSSVWLNNKVVVEEKEQNGTVTVERLVSGKSPVLENMPTIVLINEGSASASEIVAGALQDHGAAKLVGTTSFGKGSVQVLEKLGDGGELKVTIARWYTPNGNNIDQDGIDPDVKVELSDQDLAKDRDPQRARAIRLLNGQ